MDLICFSHLRWNFVYQRPQHLLSRFAKVYRIFYIEEPLNNSTDDKNEIEKSKEDVWVVIPHLKSETNIIKRQEKQKKLLAKLFEDYNIVDYIFWYYTPMSLPYSRHLHPAFTVYDCMDELSAFKFAPPLIKELEKELFKQADIVFTGGHSLYEAKKNYHHNIHLFPSSIDKDHFLKARYNTEEPEDQKAIPHPRIGFFGVIDERFDIDLIQKIADARNHWQFIFIGPIVKIEQNTLPKENNIHYLGKKSYDKLPYYINYWQIAIIPFALNESTQFISPTKTPEYLAAGKPVISTAIKDVIHPYGINNLVHIIHNYNEFIERAEKELNNADRINWLQSVDNFLLNSSWDNTYNKMKYLIFEGIALSKEKSKVYNV